MKNVNIIVPDTSYNLVNTRVFVVIKELNAVVYTYGPYASSALPTTWYTHIPENTSIRIVVMTRKIDSYYYFEKETNVLSGDISITATMTKQTKDYIKAKLAAM